MGGSAGVNLTRSLEAVILVGAWWGKGDWGAKRGLLEAKVPGMSGQWMERVRSQHCERSGRPSAGKGPWGL